MSSQAQALYDTVVPNQYSFQSTEIHASQGATQALVTVRFYPGNRSFSGRVGYGTRDGTAVANHDYTPVSGSLYFSGNAELTFKVPLLKPDDTVRKTIRLVLFVGPDEGAYTTNASLHINMPRPPDLQMERADDSRLVLSWDNDGSETWVEKLEPGGTWARLYPQAIYSSGGRINVIDGSSSPMALYRLRREQ